MLNGSIMVFHNHHREWRWETRERELRNDANEASSLFTLGECVDLATDITGCDDGQQSLRNSYSNRCSQYRSGR